MPVSMLCNLLRNISHPFQYDNTSRYPYALVLEKLKRVLATLRCVMMAMFIAGGLEIVQERAKKW